MYRLLTEHAELTAIFADRVQRYKVAVEVTNLKQQEKGNQKITLTVESSRIIAGAATHPRPRHAQVLDL